MDRDRPSPLHHGSPFVHVVPVFFSVVLLYICLAPPLAAGVGQWTSVGGPAGGDRIDQVAVDPQNPSTVFAVGLEDLYRSRDGGHNWTRLRRAPERVNVVAIDPEDSDHVYAARGRVELFQSRDGGDSWELLSRLAIVDLVLDPAMPQRLYAITVASFFVSEDGGETWNESPLPGGSAGELQELVLDPAAPQSLYVRDRGLWRSADGGASWTRIADPVTAMTAAQGTVYADPGGSEREILRSLDGGATFERVAVSGLPHGRFTFLEADTRSPQSVFAFLRDAGVYHSADGGASWALLTGAPQAAGIRDFEFVGPAPGTIFLGTGAAGVFRSLDGGASWAESSAGLPPVFLFTVTNSPANPSVLYASSGGGQYRSPDAGESWVYVGYGLPALQGMLFVDPQNAGRLFAGPPSGELLMSLDGGDHWAPTAWNARHRADGTVADPARVESLAFDPESPEVIYAAGAGRLFRSGDGGVSWSELAGIRPVINRATRITALAVDPLVPSTVYAGTPRRVVRSLDGGTSWGSVSEDFGAGQILVDPRDSSRLYVHAGSSGLHRSTDGGLTWEPWNEGLSGAARDFRQLLLVPQEPPTAYLAHVTAGVFERPLDGSRPWLEVGGGSTASIVSLAAIPGPPRILFGDVGSGGLSHHQLVPRRSRLVLQDGRFEVAVEWRDAEGQRGSGMVATAAGQVGQPAPLLSRDSGVVEFFDGDNWEMLIKVLNGRQVNDHYWVFFGAATDVAFTTTVTDTVCGVTKRYVNPLGLAAPAVTDTMAFPAFCDQPLLPNCTPSIDTLCLGLRDRFQVEIEWQDALGDSGRGRRVAVREPGHAESEDSGLFYFFTPDNWELLVKVLDGCSVNGHFWVFGAATTDVEYELTVTDTATGETAEYFNPLGVASSAINDTAAFACDAGIF